MAATLCAAGLSSPPSDFPRFKKICSGSDFFAQAMHRAYPLWSQSSRWTLVFPLERVQACGFPMAYLVRIDLWLSLRADFEQIAQNMLALTPEGKVRGLLVGRTTDMFVCLSRESAQDRQNQAPVPSRSQQLLGVLHLAGNGQLLARNVMDSKFWLNQGVQTRFARKPRQGRIVPEKFGLDLSTGKS